jgi:hypothetical protein
MLGAYPVSVLCFPSFRECPTTAFRVHWSSRIILTVGIVNRVAGLLAITCETGMSTAKADIENNYEIIEQ